MQTKKSALKTRRRARVRRITPFKVTAIAALVFLAGVCVGVATHYLASMQAPKAAYPITFTGENYREASSSIAAVRPDGLGIIATLTVRIGPGDGRILVDTRPLVGFDFQYSHWIAVKVAAELTNTLLDNDGVGLQGANVLFIVSSRVGEVEIQAVDGSSAGAAATIATVAAIENKKVKEDVIITGTIGEDHKIGLVGGVAAKAKAANDNGAKHFLVPKGQYVEVYEQVGMFTVVRHKPISYLQNYAAQQGWQVQIQEVATIEEAAALMLE